jgi:HK97 family phage portal protein
MGARLQDWWTRNIWDVSQRSHLEYDGLSTINGSLLKSILIGDHVTDEPVSIRSGLRVSAVYTCVNVPACTIASLPINVIQESKGKKEVLADHPVYWLLSQEPNDYMTAPVFWHTIMTHVGAWGNAFAYINRDSRQKPSSLDLWEPWKTEVSIHDGQLWYRYDKGEWVTSWDVLHYRFNSLDGICGLSPILENTDTVGMAIKLKRYASLILGAQPPGVASYEGNLTPEQKAENKKEWKSGSKGDIKVMSGKWTYSPIMTPGDEVQYNETKRANERDIYGIWQLPPTFAQNFERATFANAEQSDLVYAKHTITPKCVNIEKENNMKLFFEREKATIGTKFNMNGLLRGDLAARQAFYQTMITSGVYKRNEARNLEDLNPYDGGDVPVMQGAMIPADEEGIEALRKKMEKETIPSATPAQTKLNGHSVFN